MTDDATHGVSDEVPEPDDQNGQEQGSTKMDELQQKIAKAQAEDAAETEAMSELEQALAAQKEAEDRALRALAELKNAQQRMENEKNQFAAFATQGLVMQVLEIYENHARLMSHKPDWLSAEMDKNGNMEWLKGLELIDQQFARFLEQQGVQLIEVKPGDTIDPEKHEAMMTGEGPAGEVLEVFSQGYEMKGRVIKTAKVKVGKG